jgi:GTP-binding protein EngB required for normal cell division
MEDSGSKGVLLFANLRKVINLVDELRDIGVQQYIKLPRIAVLGTQSSGKSSLLESIVGLDFLPRGDGVVTRRPLELRLAHIGTADQPPYAIFDVQKDVKYTDFDKVREKIEKLTDEVAGKNKGIVDDPIILNVYSNSCPDLTLIDLPGITRIPLANSDQKEDVEKITKNMAATYCKDPRTIILCVVPANQDMSTSDGLQMARELDPSGERTIGVITKIDIMDKGTNAKKGLLGQEIPLKLGFVGVKGRSQQDINDKMRVKRALELEKQFFATHAVYSTMPPGHCGTDNLTARLTKVFFNHIKRSLPEVLKEINIKIKDCEERLKILGTPLPSTSKEKLHLLWNMITSFVENFKNTLKGKYDAKHSKSLKIAGDLSGGAKIKMMFGELYGTYLDSTYKATADYSDRDIEKAIIMHEGNTIPGFPSFDAFLFLLQPLLDRLKEPAIELMNTVYQFLEELAQGIMTKLFVRFPQLTDMIGESVTKVLQKERDNTRRLVESIIEAEQQYLFTNDQDYLLNRTNLIPKENGQKQIDPKLIFVTELRNRIDAFFRIVVRNMRDSIPKTIGYFLVRAAQDNMQFQLYEEVNKNEELMALLSEPQNITLERNTLTKTMEVLGKARKAINKDPDLANSIKTDEEDKAEKAENDKKR